MEQIYLNHPRRLKDQYELNADLEREIAALESEFRRHILARIHGAPGYPIGFALGITCWIAKK
jgi:hypothetical protein